VKKRSQLIVATHSPTLLAYPGAKILELGEEGITEVEYEATEHYVTTRAFLENREKMLDRLLADDAS